jgi:long-chain fatty acid transport protein|tara:strand:+ start:17709 stop:18953 length:1245 start_codon:yes stop_codon:yes gene_type:complete
MNRKHIVLAIVSLVPSTVFGAGFYLKEQSIVSQGAAFAGAAARQDVASSVYFNPAGIANMGSEIEGGIHLLMPDQKVTGTTTIGALTTDTQDPLSTSVIPNFYYTRPIGDGVFGFGISAPFGSKNEYASDFVGAVDSYFSKLKTVDFSFAYGRSVGDGVRVGGALVYQTADIEQSKLLSAASTSTSTIKGDSSAIGITLGAQFDMDNGGTVGLSYKKGLNQEIEGTNTISEAITIAAGTTIAAGSYAASGTLKLPDMLSISVITPISESTDFLFDVTRYSWSSYDSLDVKSIAIINGAVDMTSSSAQNYKDTTAFSLGLEHDYGDGYVARAGVHFDPTPTNDTDRSFSTPDGDRTWLTFGGSRTLDSGVTWDLAYTYIQVKDTAIARVTTSGTAGATAQSTFNILSIGVRIPLE